MVKYKATRSELETVISNFFPYMNLQKKTRELNCITEADKLQVLLTFNLLLEVETLIKKKLLHPQQKQFAIKLTIPQAVVLLVMIQNIPIPEQQVYLLWLRNLWMNYLYMQIFP